MNTAHLDTIAWTNLRRVLQEYGDYFIQAARDDLGANGSNASFGLNDSMKTLVDIYDDHFEVNIELEDYWYYVEHGRKPGKFPPVNKIREWIEVKPVMPRPMTLVRHNKSGDKQYTVTPTVDQLAFLIGRKIANKGTDPQPFFEKNIRPTYDHFQEAIALAIDADLGEWVEQLVVQQMLYNELGSML